MRRILREIAIRTIEPSLGEEEVWYTFALFPILERRWHCGNFVYDWHTQYRFARWPLRLWRKIFGFEDGGYAPPSSTVPSPPQHINCRCVVVSTSIRKAGKWAFDDMNIGWLPTGASSLDRDTRSIDNPGLPNSLWYKHAGQICQLLNKSELRPVVKETCAICDSPHDNDMLTDICVACETRLEEEGSP